MQASIQLITLEYKIAEVSREKASLNHCLEDFLAVC